MENTQGEILRGVYPEPLRCAQSRSQRNCERAQNDSSAVFFRNLLSPARAAHKGGATIKLGQHARLCGLFTGVHRIDRIFGLDLRIRGMAAVRGPADLIRCYPFQVRRQARRAAAPGANAIWAR